MTYLIVWLCIMLIMDMDYANILKGQLVQHI